MGSKNSKGKKGEDLKKIGEDANKKDPSNFCTYTAVTVTNDLLVGKSKSNPEEDYKKLNFLGEGSFAAVYKVQNKFTDAICAMKVINKAYSCTVEDEKEILNEINILKTMDHPGILKIFEFYSNNQSFSIVTELCPGGELFQQIIDKGPFNEKYSAYVMYQILSAVNYCHKMYIIHIDIEQENNLSIYNYKIVIYIIKRCY